MVILLGVYVGMDWFLGRVSIELASDHDPDVSTAWIVSRLRQITLTRTALGLVTAGLMAAMLFYTS